MIQRTWWADVLRIVLRLALATFLRDAHVVGHFLVQMCVVDVSVIVVHFLLVNGFPMVMLGSGCTSG